MWHAVSEQPVLLVICRGPEGRQPDDFWICSDIHLPAKEIVSAYAGS